MGNIASVHLYKPPHHNMQHGVDALITCCGVGYFVRNVSVITSTWADLMPVVLVLRAHEQITSFGAMILTTKDGPLYFEIDGEGPPLVFVSGWAMSCECWRPVINAIKRKHR